MRTSVKVILAAIGAAAVAYPAAAQTPWMQTPWTKTPWTKTWPSGYVHPDLSTDNVFWGLPYPAYRHHAAQAYAPPAYGHPDGYGSAARPPAGRPHGYGPVAHPPIIDCVHVLFPNCSGGG
jgi:hypothetical protein